MGSVHVSRATRYHLGRCREAAGDGRGGPAAVYEPEDPHMSRLLVGTMVLFAVAASASALASTRHDREALLRQRVREFAREADARRPVRRCGMPVAPIQPAGDRLAVPVRPGSLHMPMTTPGCNDAPSTHSRRPASSRPAASVGI
jgi:hypothetical protein